MLRTLLILLSIFLSLAVAAPSLAQFKSFFTQIGQITSDAGAEIAAYDDDSELLFVTTGNTVEIINLSDPTNPTLVSAIDVTNLGGGANSVAVSNGIVAVAIEASTSTDNGLVAFYDTAGNLQGQATVGALPDSLSFSPDGTIIVVANEGEASGGIDPEGSISIVDISAGVGSSTVTTLGFQGFSRSDIETAGLRFVGQSANDVTTTVAQDLEPEFVTISGDGTKAFVTLQENNGVAVVDLTNNTIEELFGLGTQDFRDISLDPSDRDDVINIVTPIEPVFGMRQADAIDTFEVGGQRYLITANEGDARGFEEARVEDVFLDPTVFSDPSFNDEDRFGRLEITTTMGDTDGDGDFDELFSFGGRSFSIFDESGDLVFDSGDIFETITADLFPLIFNSNGTPGSFDSRSDAKGPEPEAVIVGEVDGRLLAFIGLERVGGFFTYDLTDFDPSSGIDPTFLSYTPNASGPTASLRPEGLVFVSATESPTGQALLIVANEESNTTDIYSLAVMVPEPASVLLLAFGGTSVVLISRRYRRS